jgi:hypothetical protein
MSNPMMRIHDMETNEVIDREMTDVEYADYLDALKPQPLSEDEQKAADNKAALLAKLGITAEEAQLLLGGN